MSKPDRTDVLELLLHHARLSVEEIAERLQLTTVEVARLIEECETEGTILGYHTVLADQAIAGRAVRAMIEVSVEPERDAGFDHVAERIAKFPEVTDVLLVSGNYDLLILVEGSDLQEVANFVASKLSPLKGVRSTRSHFLLKKYKESGFTLGRDEDYERLTIAP